MQMVLVQAEIEAALKAYISSLVPMTSDATYGGIELSATRGATGITATVELTLRGGTVTVAPTAAATVAEEPAAETVAATPTPRTRRASSLRPVSEPDVVKTAVALTQEEEEGELPFDTVEEDAALAATDGVPVSDVDAANPQAEEAPVTPKRSSGLFSGMSRPTNATA